MKQNLINRPVNPAKRSSRKGIFRLGTGFLSLMILGAAFLIGGCSNLFEPPGSGGKGNTAGGSLVRIVIGGESPARTIQPGTADIAGYRLTFSGGPAHAPVDITEGNSANIYLADGTYTITATAYKAGGTIGNAGDKAAEGSISITLLEGAVTSNGGVVPPVILGPAGTSDGVLGYAVTIGEEVSGILKLWDIDGTTPVSGFDWDGELEISASVDSTHTLPAGRYIARIRLENSENRIAFLEEVIEIWAGVTTTLAFEPTVYVDPSAVPIHSGADLSPESTIGGAPIGTGSGSGTSDDPVSYALEVGDITSAPVNLALESGSRFAGITWAANTGTAPGGEEYSAGTLPADFSTNYVLWVTAVSEDQSTTRYYKFTLTEAYALTVSSDTSYTYEESSGLRTLTITGSGTYTIGMPHIVTTTAKDRIVVASGLTGVNITLNGVNIDLSGKADTAAFDMTGATVNLTLNGTNVLKSGLYKAGILVSAGSDLTIMAASTGSLEAVGGTYGAGIGGDSVIDNPNNATKVTGNDGGTVTIRGGTVTASSNYGAGIGGGGGYEFSYGDGSPRNAGAGGAITIEDGTVTASSNRGAGIGGGYALSSYGIKATGGAGGTILIKGGTVTAASSSNSAGIGGGGGGSNEGIGGAGGTITIEGGTVTATGGGYGTGIGGGYGVKTSGGGATILIKGGMVTATVTVKGSQGGMGIGGGSGSSVAGSITELSGNAVVFASSIQPTITAGSNATQAIVFNGDAGTMYGNVTLGFDVTIPSGRTLTIAGGHTLTVPGGVTLTNSGTIFIYSRGLVTGTVTGNQPVHSDLTIAGGSSYTYVGGVLTITGDGDYTIGMKNGVSETSTERIVVSSGVTANITLNGVNIDMSGKGETAAFDMSGATVTLTLEGANTLKSGSGRAGLQAPSGSTLTITAAEETASLTATGGDGGAAGIGGGYNSAGGTITISGGTVTAASGTGGYGGAGIGGGFIGAGGTITIEGGEVTAMGRTGAGIGGGYEGAGGTVAITGGTVTATSNTGAGIGGGSRSSVAGSITELSGNAMVFASSIQPTLTAGGNATQAIVFSGNTGTVYGDVILGYDVTIPSGRTLNIPADQTLTVPEGIILSNQGTIRVLYEGTITIAGEVAGNTPIYPFFTVSGPSFTYGDEGLTIGDGIYTITISSANGAAPNVYDRIVVSSGVTAGITLDGVNIDMSGKADTTAFDMTGATVTLTLEGANTLKSGENKAGLEVPVDAALTITANSTGSLEAVGGYSGAGIGGGYNGAGGTITISGGTVNALGGYHGAGIGGGLIGAGGTITITGGIVTATSEENGAGIGGGFRGAGGTIAITGGIVTAMSPGIWSGAGIGGGREGAGGTVTISGGTVTATGGSLSSGIGGGYNGAAGTITALSGNAVVFTSSIAPTLENATLAIVFNGNAGTMYGNVELQQDVTIPSTHTLDFATGTGQTLTIPGTVTLTNEGTINKYEGTIVGAVGGGGTVND
jgi:hypothetical protein